MSRLVIVSNRVDSGGAGGLAVALGEALRDRRALWLGWSGKLGEDGAVRAASSRWRRLSMLQLDLSRSEYEQYYLGHSNRCLWPLLHFRADLMDYHPRAHERYRQVNARFASALQPQLEADDLIWVHDFHLFLLAAELRALGVTQRIGLFLHTPFPPRDILAALPGHRELARALCHFDLIGFQTAQDLRRFSEYMTAEHQARIDAGGMLAFQRRVELGDFPIGIDGRRFRRYAFSAAGEREWRRMRAALRGRQQIVGVDRLDYSKGLRRRMEAVARLFEKHPDAQGQLEYLQIAPLSRSELKAYRDYRRELEQVSLTLNAEFARVDWTPVRYLNRAVPRRTLAGIYRASRIGLVTPMRDGMNLVAKEYVAAQDAEDPGVLILSRFAGAAQQMDSALLINPYDTEDIADAIQRARSMPLAERRRRHVALLDGVLREGNREWAAAFLRRLTQSSRLTTAARAA